MTYFTNPLQQICISNCWTQKKKQIVTLQIFTCFVQFLKYQSIVHWMKNACNVGINMTSMAYSTRLLSKKTINLKNLLMAGGCNQVNPLVG